MPNNENDLRNVLKELIREVLSESFNNAARSYRGYRDEEDEENDDQSSNNRGTVRDPEHDRRLKRNRG